MLRSLCVGLLSLLWCAVGARPDGSGSDKKPALERPRWRQIGPAVMGGRITDLAVVESKPQIFYVAAATGGVWKTVNNGTTWTPVFDRYGAASIGAVAVHPRNPDVVWVGTGEANPRNSVTHGDGVYKSTDGGKTFRHMGLRDTRHIGRVALDPRDPNVAYVAALGSVYVPSNERGLYRTSDGGKSWTRILWVNGDTGVVDVAVHPVNPDILFAAAYSARRDGFSGSGSPSRFEKTGGLYKSQDGGKSWKRLAEGLPTAGVGRGGIAISRKDPRVVYAVLETRRSNRGRSRAYLGIEGEDAERGVRVTRVHRGSAADQAGLKADDVLLAFDRSPIRSVRNLIDEIRKRKVGAKVRVRLLRGGKEMTVTVTLGRRNDDRFWDQVAYDPEANEGGVFRSDDGGETWNHVSKLNPRPFYYSQIRIDPRNSNRVYVLGVRLHVSEDGGRTFRSDGAPRIHVDHHALWIDPRDSDHLLLGCDGGLNMTYDGGRSWEHLNNLPLGQFYAIGVDTREPYWVYGGLQDNGSWAGPSRTREAAISNEHWSFLSGGDGFYCRVDPADPDTVYVESQYGGAVRLDRRTGKRKSIRPKEKGLRFEWNTPLELSPHDSKRVYLAAQMLFESTNRGEAWKRISGDLTKTRQGSISVIGPSPVDENVIWIGTNDGGVHVTRDRGKTWTECKVEGLPGLLWVTRVEPSRAAAGTAYLTVEGRRKNDLRPYVYKTVDFGETWTYIVSGLPSDEPAYVVREDPRNPAVLYLGTERTVYASLSAGRRWVRLGSGLPVVPVHDLAVHPGAGELVAATHGRSIWIVDVSPLQHILPKSLFSRATLFPVRDGVLWRPGKSRWFGGVKDFRGENPPGGISLWYYLGWAAKQAALEIRDRSGRVVRKLKVETQPGLHHATWSLVRRRGRVSPGDYVAQLVVDGRAQERPFRVVGDPEVKTE